MTLTERNSSTSNNRKMALKSFKQDERNNGKKTVFVRDSSDRTRLLKVGTIVKSIKNS